MTKAELTKFIDDTAITLSIGVGLLTIVTGAIYSYSYWARYQPPKDDGMVPIAMFCCLTSGIAVALLTGAVMRTWLHVFMLRYFKPKD